MLFPARRLAYAPDRTTVALEYACCNIWLAARPLHFAPRSTIWLQPHFPAIAASATVRCCVPPLFPSAIAAALRSSHRRW